MANDAASIIVIDDKVLRQFDDYDKKLERMKQNTADAVKAVNSSFASLGAGGGGIDTTIGALDKLIAKLGEVGEAGKNLANVGANASAAASGFENAGNSAASAANAARGATNGLQGAAEMLADIESKLVRPFKQVSMPDMQKLKDGYREALKSMEGQPMDAENTARERDIMNAIRLIEQEMKYRRAADREKLTMAQEMLKEQTSNYNTLLEAQKAYIARANALDAARAKQQEWRQKSSQSLGKAASANPDGRNTELTNRAKELEEAEKKLQEVIDNGIGGLGIKNFNQAVKNAVDNIRNMKNALDEALGETQLQKNAPKKSYKELMGGEADVMDSGHIGRIKEEIKDIEKLLNYSGSNLTKSETQALIDLEARYRRSVEELRKTTDEKNGIVENASKKTREAYARLGGNLGNVDIESGQRDLLSAISGKNSATNRLRGVLNSNRTALMQDGAGSPVESGYQDLVKLLDEAKQREKELENTKGMPVDEWLDKLREYKDFLKQVDDAAQTLQGRVANSSTLSSKQADGIRGALSTARMMANKNMGEVSWADKNLSAASKNQAMVEAQIKRVSDLKKRLEDLSVAYEELKTAQKDRNADGSLTDEAKALIDEKDKVQALYDQELKSIDQIAAEESKRRAKEEAETAAQAERDAKAAENEATRSENAKNKAITAELRYQDELRKTQEIIDAGNRQLETVGTDSKFGGDKLDSEIQELITRKQDLDDAIERMQDAVANGADSKEVNRYTEEVRQATRAVQNQERAVVSARRESQRLYNEANDPSKITADEAIKNSDAAKSIRERVEALKRLQEAYNNLDPNGGKDSATDMARINAQIERQTRALRQVGVAANGARLQQNSLLNTSQQLARKLALVFSVSQIAQFGREMLNVRAQFELTERSLVALTNNARDAARIFEQVKGLAVKSPFTAMELSSYTKQLAAYRIENDKLFDTTKRLADVSAGLGVDMDRLILAYGQVKAAAYLRGTEVRQFTEAGVNVYGELQKYFAQVKGEAYSVSQIVDMISNKQVTFEDLDAVLKRLTDEGGTFYNMQSIQADTLAGKMGNLQDQYQLMLDKMGRVGQPVVMGFINSLQFLMQNWKFVGAAIGGVLSILAGNVLRKAVIAVIGLKASFMQLGAAITAVGNGAQITGAKVATAMATLGGPIAVITAVIGAVATLLMQWKANADAAREEMRKYQEDQVKFADRIGKIKVDFDAAGTFDLQKQTFERLKEEAKNADIKIPLHLQDVSERDVREKFIKVQNLILKLQKTANLVLSIDGVGKSPEEITKNKEDLDESEAKLRQNAIEVRNIINSIEYGINAQITKQKELADASNGYSAEQVAAAKAELEVLEKKRQKIEELSKLDTSGKNLAKNLKAQLEGLNTDTFLNQNSGQEGDHYKWGVYDTPTGNQFSINSIKLWNLRADIKNFYREVNSKNEQWREAINVVFTEWQTELRKVGSASGDELQVIKEEIQAAFESAANGLQLSDVQARYFFDMVNKQLANVKDATGQPFHIKFQVEDPTPQVASVLSTVEKYLAENPIILNVKTKYLDSDVNTKNTEKDDLETLERKYRAADAQAKRLRNAVRHKGFEAFKASRDNVWNEENSPLDKDEMGDVLGRKWNYVVNGIEIGRGDVDKILKRLEDKKAQALEKYEQIGGDVSKLVPQKTPKGKTPPKGEERDIWLERIQVLKDMSAKYYELRQTIGEKAALEEIKRGYKSTLELLKMPQNLLDKFYDKNMKKAGLYEAIEMSIPSIKKAEDRGKERQAQAVLKVEVKKEQVDEAVEQAGIWAQEAADKLDIYTKFHDMGLNNAQIESMFGKLPTSISEQITEYENKWKKAFTTIDKEGKEIVDTSYMDKNTEQGKKYYDGLKNLQDANAKHFVELAADVVKTYRDQLSEQVKLDLEYAQQRAKIYEKDANGNYILNDWQRDEAMRNLDKTTGEKRNKLALDEFQNSDTYLEIFQNLDRASDATLARLEDRLNAIKNSLKELDPTSLKTIMDIQNKIGEQRLSLEPFKEYIRLLKEAKELTKNGRSESELNNIIVNNDAIIQEAQAKKNAIEKKLASNSYVNFIATSKGQSGQPLTPEMQKSKAEAESLNKEKEQQEEVIKNAKKSNEQASKDLKTYQDKRTAAQKSADAVGQVLEQTEKLHTAMSGLFDALGASDSTAAIFSDMAMSLAQSVLQTIMLQLQLNAASVAAEGFAAAMNSAAGILGWILLAVQAITTIFTAIANNKDKKITKKIEKLKREIEDLSESFEQLEKNIDSAFTLDAMNSFTEQSIQNLEEQNRKQQEIINAEKKRKKSNQDTIRDAEKTIRDNDRQIEELKNVRRQQNLGGWGSDENYKSQAQSFVDAWLDAYAEVGDSMKALKDTWNDVLKNIMKKTIMYKVASKIVDQFLKPIDSALEQYAKDGDIDKLADSINQSTESFEQNLPAFNNIFKQLAEKFNLNSITDNLSSLQQGIQGVTEDTAEALEGMLNSIRNYVSLQRNDVAAIRKILEAHYGSAAATSNPKNPAALPSDDVQINNQMLAELKTQTDYLRRMDSKFTDIFTSTQSKGFGIRVFVQ